MTNKRFSGLIVLLAFAAFAAAPTAAQAAPHFYRGGALLKETTKKPIIGWGTLMLTSAGGVIQCQVAILGKVWNPPGNAAGKDEILSVQSGECVSEGCPSTITLTSGPGMTWNSELIEPKAVTRDEWTNTKLRVTCLDGETVLATYEFETNSLNKLTPEWVNGTSGCNKPSEVEFGAESGTLEDKIFGRGTLEGSLKICGFEKGELISAL